MKHLTDCSWLAGRDVSGCTCAERIFLESCSEEEREAFRRHNPSARRLNLAETAWVRPRS